MRLLLALAAVLAAPLADAQGFVRADADLGPVVRVEAPAALVVLDQLGADGARAFSVLAVRGADGAVAVVADSLHRPPGLAASAEGWHRATQGCGTACFTTWYLDPATGRASPGVFTPVLEDEAAGWVLAPRRDGLLLVDPFDPSWAWVLPVAEDAPLSLALRTLTAEVARDGDEVVVRGEGVELRAALPRRDG